ncbi:MAG TPA: HepT-like ribonuclease domain-containing protein [Candidatus Eisenbacteria bacterium]
MSDIVESCEAITNAVRGLDLAGYEGNRLVRSSVEREFIIIGEAASALARIAPKAFDAITRARRIVDFRNQLTHEYPTVDNALVWAIAEHDVPVLRRECSALMQGIAPAQDAG